MTLHKDYVSVAQMVDAMESVGQYLGTLTPGQIEADQLRRDAVVLQLQVIGEAARRVSQATMKDNPAVEWSGWIRLRNRISHGYDTIDYELVWTIGKEEIPKAMPALRKLAAALRKKGT